MRYANHKTRRGVLLLVILALLAMFAMVAVTFVVVASQARLAAEAHQRLDETTDPPRKLLNAAVMQVLRGSTNPASAIGPHSLLEDVYGNDSVAGSGTLQYFDGDQSTEHHRIAVAVPAGLTTDAQRLRRVGCVLTVTANNFGCSTRIVGYDSATSQFLLLPFPGQTYDGTGTTVQLNGHDVAGEYIISGVPFSGAGFGWNGTAMTNLALQPGHSDNRLATVQANEDYDAADFQNMILAAQIPDGTTGQVVTIPSLHRPALVNNLGTGSDYILRPTKNQHPIFTGGNVNGATALGFDPVIGPWDVDNDGDGIADSIWVDLGMPARAAADGRLYKPLFAILCVDLDGRLNVNAHGSLAQAHKDYFTLPTLPPDDVQFADGSPAVWGAGTGPAEINLSKLLSVGRARQLLLARYNNGGPGAEMFDYRRWFNYWFEGQYTSGDLEWVGSATPGAAYATPPDIEGTIPVGLDRAGRPIWVDGEELFWHHPQQDDPYEMNPLRRVSRGMDVGVDAAFSTTELERLLRLYDRDANTLPLRLLDLLNQEDVDGDMDLRYARHEVTTDSIDVPVVGRVAHPSGNRYASFMEMLADEHGITDLQNAVRLFGPDLVAGRKLNLSRPLPALPTGASEDERRLYLEPRQELARHLFCLAMLLSEPHPPTDPLVVRRLAQWAVNVIDFIDSDSIMTPFQYDPEPFDAAGWTPPVGVTDNLVWGMERPALLLTETLALHDRRVADTRFDHQTQKMRTDEKKDDDGEGLKVPADDHLDQPRVPQGSLFVELYCTMEPGEKPTTDLYVKQGDEWYLDVSRLVGAGRRAAPVWRLAITGNARTNPDRNKLDVRLKDATFSLETDTSASLVPGAAESIEIERVVSFARTPREFLSGASLYFNRNDYHDMEANLHLGPGQYLVVGPRKETAIGSTMSGWPPGPSPQKIKLDPVEVTADALGGPDYAYPGAGEIRDRDRKAMIAESIWPGDSERWIGISISEPRPQSYYPPPDYACPFDPDDRKEWYGAPDMDEDPAYRNTPLDNEDGRPLAASWDGDPGTATRTTPAFKYVLLQRLADPTRPHEPDPERPGYNPYRTVDWMPIDLTVFNGSDSRPQWPPAWAYDENNVLKNPDYDWEAGWDPYDPNEEDPDNHIRFDTRRRGRQDADHNNLWATRDENFSLLREPRPGMSSSEAFFAHPLQHSLGFLSLEFEPRWSEGEVSELHIGDPKQPFPWLTWNNRPLVNPLELLMVPATTAARFGWEYTITGVPTNPYTSGGDFAHLMNFFHSGTGGPNLHRILDFVTVPSRFAGAHWYAMPEERPDGTLYYRDPPNHLIPTYRDPGKINLNTVFSDGVFQGLMNRAPGATVQPSVDDLWRNFVRSRRGYGDGAHMLEIDPSVPTRFARPFRSAAAGGDIESTLLRSEPGKPNTPLFAFDSNDDINDTDRNPYFRYQGLMRLSNLVTTRSNVYAVWITVGFFEATPNTSLPGGYQLSYELGADTGEIRRHRAFYMIDRSIPVGFVRGEDLNVANTVLLQRFIE